MWQNKQYIYMFFLLLKEWIEVKKKVGIMGADGSRSLILLIESDNPPPLPHPFSHSFFWELGTHPEFWLGMTPSRQRLVLASSVLGVDLYLTVDLLLMTAFMYSLFPPSC
jgi:hypothetical protein